MNEKLLNMVFKISLLFIGISFLAIYFFHSQNGRYQYFLVDTETALGPAKTVCILDNRIGKVYRFEQERNWAYDFKNGEVVTRKVKWNSMDK